jgi:hypothetical protein
MARRKSRKTPARRSSPKKTNVLNLAQSVILGNAVTEGLFNTNMYEFVTGRIGGAYTPGAMSQSDQITLPELLGAGFGSTEKIRTSAFGAITSSAAGYGGVHGKFSDVIKSNIQANGVQMMTTLVVTPIAFKVISKLAKKPRAEFNKLARNVGLPISM